MNDTHPYDTDAAAIVRQYRPIEALLPPHWQAGTVFANGIRHHYYRTGGYKPPLVLLHGFLEGALTWLRAARALEPEYDMIMIDARGHGGSDRAMAGFSQAALVEDVAGVIRALGLGAPRVIGHSQGGATGIHLAAAYPELVHALIVEGWGDDGHQSGDFASSPAYQAWFNGYLAWLERLKTLTHAERMVAALGQLPPGAPVLPEDEYVPWVENCARLDLDLVRNSATMWSELAERKREMVEALARTTCPVLIMKSSFFPQPGAPQSIQEESSDRPNVRIVRFENTGHLIHRDQLDQFVRVASQFLREH